MSRPLGPEHAAPGGAPGALVRRYDPGLFLSALFAREPGRTHLLLLYAADIEFARAVLPAKRSDAGPLIAQMRLQFWRDIVLDAKAGGTPRAHEIGEPLAEAVVQGILPADALLRMIEGHAREIDPELPPADFDAWAAERFGARLAAALACLGGAPEMPAEPVAGPAGLVLGSAFALKSAAAMAAEGRVLVPGLAGSARTALASGHVDPARAALRDLVERGLAAQGEALATARGMPSAARPALLPLWEAKRVLTQVWRDPRTVFSDLAPGPGRRALGLSFAVVTGRI
ncbi:MAG: squalene/phytoene synthase family protein [Pikeienuella sp.]